MFRAFDVKHGELRVAPRIKHESAGLLGHPDEFCFRDSPLRAQFTDCLRILKEALVIDHFIWDRFLRGSD